MGEEVVDFTTIEREIDRLNWPRFRPLSIGLCVRL